MASLLLSLLGYKIDSSFVEAFEKQKIAIFPHTSLCEVVIVCIALSATGMRKKFCFPVTYLYYDNIFCHFWLKFFGGFAVRNGTKTTERTIEYLKNNPDKCMAISPEGSISAKEWKKGFFYIAKETGIPIIIAGIDFSTHTIRCIKEEYKITAEDDIKTKIPEIQKAFAESGIAPLYPEASNPRIIVPAGTKTSMLPLKGKIFVSLLGIGVSSAVILPILKKIALI